MRKHVTSKAIALALCVTMAAPNVALPAVYAAEATQTDAYIVEEPGTEIEPVDLGVDETVEEVQTFDIDTETESDISDEGLNADVEEDALGEGENLKYTEVGKSYGYVYQYSDDQTGIIIRRMTDGSVVTGTLEIPSTIDGKPVTTIWDYAFAKSTNTENDVTFTNVQVVFPDTLTTIGQYAFNENTGVMGAITFPESLTSIGDRAFYKCTKLTGNIIIPAMVTEIGERAFCDCTGFNGRLEISNKTGDAIIGADRSINIGKEAFSNCSGLTGTITLHRIGDISEAAFYRCTKLTGDLTLPEGTKTVGKNAFYQCKALNGVLTIPSTVVTIGEGAFQECTLLKTPAEGLVIPDEVKSIGKSAFNKCSSLEGSLTLPNGLESIGESAFSACVLLTGDLTIPDTVTELGPSAFYGCASMDGVLTLPQNITGIPASAFAQCPLLKCGTVDGVAKLSIPDSVTSIGNNAFLNCASMNGKLVLPSGVTSIGSSAFEGCSGLNGALTLPSEITTIGQKAFSGCSGFTGRLTVPEKITVINKETFSGCSGMTSLVLPSGLKTINEAAFSGCSGFAGKLTIPETVQSIGKSAFADCSGFTGDLVIPDSVRSVGEKAFYQCSGFSGDLIIGTNISLGTFGKSAFAGCSGLGSEEGTGDLVLPSNIKAIGDSTFMGCENLKSVKLTRDLQTVSSTGLANIADNAFVQCNANLKYKVYKYSPADEWLKAKYPDDYANLVIYLQDVSKIVIFRDGVETESTSVVQGGTVQLSAVCEPADVETSGVTWSSSATSIATVDANGLVTTKRTSGSVTITATAKDGSGTKAECVIMVNKQTALTASNTDITFDKASYTYSGAENKPNPTVTYNGTRLVKDTDYTVTYKNNINAGTATCTITGTGEYSGSVNKTFTIGARAITSGVTGSMGDEVIVYDGKAKKPVPVLTYKDANLVSGKDFTLSYSNNTEIGNATVTVTGKGNFTGTMTLDFVIKPGRPSIASLSNASTGIKITWKTIPGAKGYYIYRKDDSTGVYKQIAKVASPTATSYIDTTAANGKNYAYRVQAYKSSFRSQQSQGKQKLCVATPKLTQYKNVATNRIALTWSENSLATGYEIQYSTNSDMSQPTTIKVQNPKTVSKAISGLTKGKTYYVRVRAYKTVSGKTTSSGWSGKKTIVIKK